MRKYNSTDIQNFTRDERGYLECPSGDYTQIRTFPEKCNFGIGNDFGSKCEFGNGNIFDLWNTFGDGCEFGIWNTFGDGCKLGLWSIFGDGCGFGNECLIECDKELAEYFKVEGLGTERRCTYFFQLTDGSLYVRCGCFAGTEPEFLRQVEDTRGGTIHEDQYKMALELAKLSFVRKGG